MKPISKAQLIFTGIVIVLITVLIIKHNKKEATLPPNDSLPQDQVDSKIKWPSVATQKETIDDSNQYYTITVSYPVTNDAHINNTFKAFAENQIEQFKKDAAWVTDPSIESAAEGSLTLDVDYKESKNDLADNYIFSIVSYTGGAHGLQVSSTFAYDEIGGLISVEKLFTNGQNGLKTISSFVQKELISLGVSDPEWIAEGAAPNVQNYKNFLIEKDGLTFIFDPYQVAPYAAGIQKIFVPISVFKNIANPDIFSK